MKPVIVFCLALICMGMVLAAPAPEPLGVVGVAVPTVVFTGAGTVSGAAAIVGAKLLGAGALLAAGSQ